MKLKPLRRVYRLLILGVLLVMVGLISHYAQQPTSLAIKPTNQANLSSATFVGRAACANCHPDQNKRWQGSHHDLAMQEASEASILGDFNAAVFSKDGITTTFFRQNSRFMVRTDGPDGQLADFEIKYTFGVTPLQQYLIELPGGRLQALSIVWDSRPRALGGQRWFHLYPNEHIDHNDELHWSKRSQNWNFMCAECHSTDFQKNYDAASDSYHSTWSEIDVSCEACHGPGSRHVAWVSQESSNDVTKGLLTRLNSAYRPDWQIDPASGNAVAHQPAGSGAEIEVCARCHSRRAQLFGDYHYAALLDSHLPSLLTDQLYHADGQIDGEVYEYGSFLQSKMYHAGVRCSDCHEPHSVKLRLPVNELCGQCHRAAKYDTEQHHFHAVGKAGAFCIDCHMPSKTYMGVDARRDHGFRVPRPDQSERLGTPNPCNACHTDKTAEWAAQRLRAWYGRDAKGYQNYAEALHAARAHKADADDRLTALLQDSNQPAIARATAVAALSAQSLEPVNVIRQALQDSDPLLRRAGLEALEQLAPEQRWAVARELLNDPIRSLRALAASALAGAAEQHFTPNDQKAFELAAGEYLAALQWNADDPAAQVNLGNFYAARNQSVLAERAYRAALTLDPKWLPAYINWADYLRVNKRDDEGGAILQQGLRHVPDSAALHHSLGLLAMRQQNIEKALDSLRLAVQLQPEDARFSYVYAAVLANVGRLDEARAVLQTALSITPNDAELQALQAALGLH